MIYQVEIFNPVTQETSTYVVSNTNYGVQEIMPWANQIGITIRMHDENDLYFVGMPYIAFLSPSSKSSPAATDAGTGK